MVSGDLIGIVSGYHTARNVYAKYWYYNNIIIKYDNEAGKLGH